jgi:hypothetical protein
LLPFLDDGPEHGRAQEQAEGMLETFLICQSSELAKFTLLQPKLADEFAGKLAGIINYFLGGLLSNRLSKVFQEYDQTDQPHKDQDNMIRVDAGVQRLANTFEYFFGSRGFSQKS